MNKNRSMRNGKLKGGGKSHQHKSEKKTKVMSKKMKKVRENALKDSRIARIFIERADGTLSNKTRSVGKNRKGLSQTTLKK